MLLLVAVSAPGCGAQAVCRDVRDGMDVVGDVLNAARPLAGDDETANEVFDGIATAAQTISVGGSVCDMDEESTISEWIHTGARVLESLVDAVRAYGVPIPREVNRAIRRAERLLVETVEDANG